MPERIVISDYVNARRQVWAELVERYCVASPKDIKAFLGECAFLADALTKIGRGVQPLTIPSVTKLRQAGFHETIDSEDISENGSLDTRSAGSFHRVTLPDRRIGGMPGTASHWVRYWLARAPGKREKHGLYLTC